jgi:hypothetical protein
MALQALFDKGRSDQISAAMRRGNLREVLRKPAVEPANGSPQPASGSRMIVPLTDAEGKITKAGYLEARRLAAEKGMKLPSNALHDDYLVMTDEWQAIRDLYPAWARELIAHPEKDGIFVPGKDIVDSETGWILPWSELVKFAQLSELSGEKKGLFIDPKDIIDDKGRMIVLPATIVVLHPFIQETGDVGTVDMATRIPLEVAPQTDVERRCLFRIVGVGVRPLARGRYGYYDYDYRRVVGGNYRPDDGLGVAIEIERK